MTCRECESSKQRRWHGVYDMTCLECCARLVASVNPDKLKAMSMLESIAKIRKAPKREAILARVKEMLNERQGQHQQEPQHGTNSR